MFPSDPLSQARELVLALTEDLYYKTREEIEADNKAEKEKEEKAEKKNRKAKVKDKVDDEKEATGESDEGNTTDSENKNEGKEMLRKVFTTDEIARGSAFKVEIVEDETEKKDKKFNFKPGDLAKTAAKAADGVKTAVAKTSAELDKVKHLLMFRMISDAS